MIYLFTTVNEIESDGGKTVSYGVDRRVLPDDRSPYEELRAHVGGLIEYAVMPHKCAFELVVNEEGRWTESFNPMMTKFYTDLWLVDYKITDLSASRLEIYGNVVVTGPRGASLSEEDIATFMRLTDWRD